ncbi:MAG: hypothetical protein WBQ62_08970 [Dehalococcoidales bacterium]
MNDNLLLKNHKNKCIGCVYLCTTGDTYIGIALRRIEISNDISSSQVRLPYYNLVCYKQVLPSFYLSKYQAKEIYEIIMKQDCLKKKWRLFVIGQTPEQAEVQESNNKSILWARLAFIAVIVSIVLTVLFFFLSQHT